MDNLYINKFKDVVGSRSIYLLYDVFFKDNMRKLFFGKYIILK